MSPYHAKKRLGQNFLHSDSVIHDMIDLLEINEFSRIIEIGPGRGSLSLPLAETGAQITGVEFDRDLQNYLKKLLRKHDNFEIVNEDFLNYEPSPGRFKIIGNIPYNITSPVIDWLVAHRDSIDLAALMVQREVADRVASSAGVRDWSPIAIFTQLAFKVQIAFEVPPSAFTPPPSVTSAVLLFSPHQSVWIPGNDLFEKLVRASFKQRRKTLVNNLVPGVIKDAKTAREMFREVGLPEKVRAEQVTIDQFKTLSELLDK